MQEELKKVISEAMDTNSNEQQPLTEFAEGELSNESLDTVAGGRCNNWSRDYYEKCTWSVNQKVFPQRAIAQYFVTYNTFSSSIL